MAALLLVPLSQAGVGPQLRADYRFQGDLTSAAAGAPPLADLGSNTFGSTTVDGTPRTVLLFAQNDGVSLSPFTSLVPFGSYTLVVLFEFTDVSGWRRIFDFKSATSDTGLYNFNTALKFYNQAPGSSGPIGAGTFVQVVLTRDLLQNVSGYVDGSLQFTFAYPSGLGLADASNLLRLFRDEDSTAPNEASAGAIARFRVYDGAFLPGDVAALDRLPGQTPSTVRFGASAYSFAENVGFATLAVTRSGNVSSNTSVQWSATAGRATPGVDFSPSGGTASFAPLQTNATFSLTMLNDLLVEGTETNVLVLSSPADAILGTPNSTMLTILDDDSNAPPTAVDDYAFAFTGSPTPISVLANDLANGSGTLGISSFGQGAIGFVFLSGSSLVYQSYSSYCGPDSFTYTITNQSGVFASATVHVTATGCSMGQPSTAVDDYAGALTSSQAVISVLSNDLANGGGPLGISAFGQGSFGSVFASGTNLIYHAFFGYCGPDSFFYSITNQFKLPTPIKNLPAPSYASSGTNCASQRRAAS